MADNRPPNRPRSLPMGMMVIGSEMASFTIVGLVIDFAAGTMPWFTVGLTLLGFVTAFTQLLGMARKLNPPSDDAKGTQ